MKEEYVETAEGERTPGLRAAFQWTGDRYRHTIGCVAAGRFVPLLQSVDGDASEAWPASPPLQQLHFELRGGAGGEESAADVALLLGMAGRSHWSLSVEPQADVRALLLDAACRVVGSASQLGSCYRLLASPWQLVESGRAELRLPELGGCVVLEKIDETCRVRIAGELLFLEPSLAGSANMPATETKANQITTTVRWRYRAAWQARD